MMDKYVDGVRKLSKYPGVQSRRSEKFSAKVNHMTSNESFHVLPKNSRQILCFRQFMLIFQRRQIRQLDASLTATAQTLIRGNMK